MCWAMRSRSQDHSGDGAWLSTDPRGRRALGGPKRQNPKLAREYATGRFTKEQLLKQTRAWNVTNRRGRALTSKAIGMLLRNRLYAESTLTQFSVDAGDPSFFTSPTAAPAVDLGVPLASRLSPLQEAAKVADLINEPQTRANLLIDMAGIAVAAGAPDLALRFASTALEVLGTVEDASNRLHLLGSLAQVGLEGEAARPLAAKVVTAALGTAGRDFWMFPFAWIESWLIALGDESGRRQIDDKVTSRLDPGRRASYLAMVAMGDMSAAQRATSSSSRCCWYRASQATRGGRAAQ
jgi:hypothetical protein